MYIRRLGSQLFTITYGGAEKMLRCVSLSYPRLFAWKHAPPRHSTRSNFLGQNKTRILANRKAALADSALSGEPESRNLNDIRSPTLLCMHLILVLGTAQCAC